MDLQTAFDIVSPPGPIETLRIEACGWPPSMRKKLLVILDEIEGWSPAEQARRLRLASKNLAYWLERAATGHGPSLNDMKRDDVSATDIAIARDQTFTAADKLSPRGGGQ